MFHFVVETHCLEYDCGFKKISYSLSFTTIRYILKLLIRNENRRRRKNPHHFNVQSDFFRMHMQVWMYCCNEYDLKENFFSEYGNFKFYQAF